ncbi:MAG TPA: hypothetical protein VFS20_19945 [Longimicrobium sp.]|nr:hypothetical protein [Longimicrobium sp.]
MSLITCPDCQQAHSQHAPACPYCGRPASVERPAFVERPAYGEPPPAYGARPGHAEPPPAYGARPGYAEAPAYGAQPGYNTPPAYGARPGYNAPPAYGAPPATWAPARPDPLAEQKQNVQIAYGLYAGSYLFGLLVFAALIMCYVKRGKLRHTWLDAHYDWLIDTFWMSLGGTLVLGLASVLMMLVFAPFGFIALIAVVLAAMAFPIYRLVVGYTALTNNRPPEGKLVPPQW